MRDSIGFKFCKMLRPIAIVHFFRECRLTREDRRREDSSNFQDIRVLCDFLTIRLLFNFALYLAIKVINFLPKDSPDDGSSNLRLRTFFLSLPDRELWRKIGNFRAHFHPLGVNLSTKEIARYLRSLARLFVPFFKFLVILCNSMWMLMNVNTKR